MSSDEDPIMNAPKIETAQLKLRLPKSFLRLREEMKTGEYLDLSF